MFWKQNQSPHIDTILVQEGLTLQELLNQDSILQELKAQNKKLIDFLTRPEILEEMISMITTEPSDDIDERERYRHPNIVCELLTTDLPFFSDKIINAESLLSKLYSFLESEPPLNPLLASFFSRTMGILLTRSQEQNWYSYQFTCLRLLEFLKSKETCIQLLMKHLGTSAIMDLTLRLVTNITDIKMKQNILRWMDSQQLIQSIIDLLDPSVDADRHSSASQLLCDIIIRSRDSDDHYESNPEPNPILNTVESPKTVEKLLNVILCGEKCETSIVGGITALLTLLEPVKSSGQSLDQENQLRYGVEINSDKGSGDHADHSSSTSPLPVAVSTIEAILPYLPQLHDLLINPPKKPPIKLNSGAVDPPLGNTRIHVAKLLSALIASHHPDINDKLAELGTIGVLLDLFFTYTWNNFLHTQVEKCLAFALNAEPALNESSPQNVLLTDIFVKCQLIQRILSAWNDNEAEQEKPGGCRRGYMGHLIRIANNIASQAEKGPLGDFIKESVPEEVLKSWQAFVTNSLEPINKIQQTCLGGGVHPGLSSSQDDAGYGGDNPLSQDSVTQQSYSEYQSQQMASQFVENFGFHENEFNDNDDSLNQSVDQLTNIPFSMAEEDDLEHQAELFNQVCSRRLDTLCDDDDDDEDDEDLNKQWSSFRRGSPANGMWNGGEEAANYNSSDDEERPGPEGREEGGQMEIDQGGADMWCSPNAAESNRDPWSGAPAPADNEGWADFDANFGVATNINTDESSDVNSSAVIAGSTSSTIATVPSPTASSVPTSSNTSTLSVELPKDSENATAVLTSTAATTSQTATGLFIRDSNANPSEDVNTDALGESQELMDNFRFLSSQGLMAATNGEITVEQPIKSNPGDKEEKETPNQEVNQSDEKIQSQPELEKVVVAVSATATTTVASPPSDNRGSDGSIKPTTIPAMDSSA